MDTQRKVKVFPVYSEPKLFCITFRENGRYKCSKMFWGYNFKHAVDQAKEWAADLPTYGGPEEWTAFDYDYVGH